MSQELRPFSAYACATSSEHMKECTAALRAMDLRDRNGKREEKRVLIRLADFPFGGPHDAFFLPSRGRPSISGCRRLLLYTCIPSL